MQYGVMIYEGLGATLYMVFVAAFFAYLIGLPIGVLVVITDSKSVLSRPSLNQMLGGIINIGRSVPFCILMVALIPFTRWIVRTSLGYKASVVPLVVVAVPFVARLVEATLLELDGGIIEAAQSMGASVPRLVFRVWLPETLPSLVRGMALTAITLVGYSTMAGLVGGGGLGDIAIRYGYYRYQADVMLVNIVILLILVQVIQAVGDLIVRRLDKRIRT